MAEENIISSNRPKSVYEDRRVAGHAGISCDALERRIKIGVT